jgi:hypothetical protein
VDVSHEPDVVLDALETVQKGSFPSLDACDWWREDKRQRLRKVVWGGGIKENDGGGEFNNDTV